jgi:hypothetical protein
MTCTPPDVLSSGTWRIISPGFPSIVTLVPPNAVGKSSFHTSVPLARLVPVIDAQLPGCIIGMVPNNETIPLGEMTGAFVCRLATDARAIHARADRNTGSPSERDCNTIGELGVRGGWALTNDPLMVNPIAEPVNAA